MELSKNEERRRIPRLTGPYDYYAWDIYVCNRMHSDAIWHLLDEDHLVKSSSQQAVLKYDEHDLKAQSTNVQNLELEPIVTISFILEQASSTARKKSQKLEIVYQNDNLHSKMHLHRRLSPLY
eukprot:gb/GEZJ01006557.1/.p1 GENE.gb/GEZJ01006557.1/~~gb/GEZJ01006557.1/.p1  ORF type:complete len:123 (-),score=13.88 gb/GEZJ01006557.1/:138-506(-)